MKAKEYIIQKLLNLGKKHRWMKYPMLALVSLISLFFLILEKCMERPKRAVIALVCLVLIISQSWYLISLAGDEASMNNPEGFGVGSDVNIANNADNSEETTASEDIPAPQDDGTTEENYAVCVLSPEGMNGYSTTGIEPVEISDLETTPYTLPQPVPTEPDCWKFTGWTINGTNIPITELTKELMIQYGTKSSSSENYTFYLYANWERVGYKITYEYNGRKEYGYAKIIDGVAMLTLLGDNVFTKTGSIYEEWLINGEPRDVNSTFTFGSVDVTATPRWIGNTYYIDFQPGEGAVEGTMESQEVHYVYDEGYDLLPACTFTREGYTFAGWEIVSGAENVSVGSIRQPGQVIENWSSVPEGRVTVKATWRYASASISYEGSPFIYSECVNSTAIVKHSDVGGGKFKIEVTNVQGETLDGPVTKDNFREVTGLDIGCSMLDGGNVISFRTLDSNGIKTVGTITISFKIEDLNNPVDENGQSTTVYPDFTIELQKKQLTITGVQNGTKVYDGDASIEVGAIQFEGAKEGAHIAVHSEGQSGSFDDPNVGTGKPITVNLLLYGDDVPYYTVESQVTLPGTGTITKRPVGVTTAPVYPEGRDYFLTGEEPEYTVTVKKEDLPANIAEDAEKIIQTAIAGNYTCGYLPDYRAGEFSVGIDTEQVNLQNYSLMVTEGKLMVLQEKPVEYIDYEISGSRQPGNQWYYGETPRITPTGTNGYDTVYLTNDSSARAVTYDASKFKNEVYVTEEMCSENGTLYIQLANSKTHAVTSLEAIEVYVDITAPVIDTANIKIATVNTGTVSKIGNFLSFGNFFKESLMVTIPVSDDLSGARTLTYYLNGSIWEDGIEIAVRNGTATFQIPIKYKGTIALTASDNAGNSSVLADLIGIEGSNVWVIENEAPEVRASAVDLDGNIAYSGEGLYYKSVKMTASVTDQDAGVAYVIWNVTKDGVPITEDSKQEVSDRSKLLTTYDFERMFTESGSYTVSVTAYDNADNASLPTEVFSFSVDGTGPDVQVSPADYDTVWSTEKTVTFTVTDTESGIDMLTLRDANNRSYPYTTVSGRENTYSFTVSKKGIYTIKAVDCAGNVTEVPLEFTRVSSEVPETPAISTNPTEPQNKESGWFTLNPEIIISEPETTPDGTQITTYYRLWEEGTDEPATSQKVNGNFNLPKEGIWNIRVWAETESGMRSQTDGLCQIKYDGTAPVISDILISGRGTGTRVSFKVTDIAGGLEKLEAIYNNDESNAQNLAFRYVGNGVYTADFTAAMKGSYTIKATDAAGNTDSADAFEPMSIVVNKITGNAKEGIVVTGQVDAGTFDIDSLTVKYGLTGQEYSNDAESLLVTTDEDGNKSFTVKFTQLNENTRYSFLITAMAKTGENCNYTGSFRTGIITEAGVNVAGTVLDETMSTGDSSYISVVLYKENDVIQIQNVQNKEAFLFTNIPDGAYTIQAVHGNRSVSKGLVIRNNVVVEPTDEIRLILRSGQSTSVEYNTSDNIQVSVSGLDNIFGDTTNFGSDQDYSVINTGGVVEFCMAIHELSEAEIPGADSALLSRHLRSNERVAKYMDFSIWKRCIGAFGIVSESQVTSISGGKNIRIVISLSEDLAAREGLSVIRVHGGSVERLADLDSNPNTYTIESALFSTYALVYTDNSINTSDNNNPGGNNRPNGNTSDISQRPNSNGLVSQSVTGNSHASPKTGDTTPIVWIGVISVVMGFAGVLLLKNKKRQ